MIRRFSALIVGLVLTGATTLGAQGVPRPKQQVPRDHLPPPGMCRIWLDNVPAGQQPAPTDCASAVRNRPSNARVIFNDAPKLPVRSLVLPRDKEQTPRAEPPRPEKKPKSKGREKRDTLPPR